jgi:hypothetical protein
MRIISELDFWNPSGNSDVNSRKKARAYKHFMTSKMGRENPHFAYEDFGEPETYMLIDYLLTYSPENFKGGRHRRRGSKSRSRKYRK